MRDPREPIDVEDPRMIQLMDEVTEMCRTGQRPDVTALAGKYGLSHEDVQGCVLAVEALETAGTPPLSLPEDFEKLQEIGRGGMGVVYRAYQRSRGRYVAVKVLPRALSEDESFIRRLDQEARSLARLDHSNIVGIHGKGQEADVHYLVLEYVEGVSLREILQTRRPRVPETLGIVGQICDALEYAHDQGIVHRDIKPDNILVGADGQVKVADYGLARLFREEVPRSRLTRSHVTLGTREYMAPEQRDGSRDVDQRADIYSLGVVLYEMLTGDLPIGNFRPPSEKNHQVQVQLDGIVLKALETDRGMRYRRAGELKEALGRNSGRATDRRDLVLFKGSGRNGAARPPRRILRVLLALMVLVGLGAAYLLGRAMAPKADEEVAALRQELDRLRERENPAVVVDMQEDVSSGPVLRLVTIQSLPEDQDEAWDLEKQTQVVVGWEARWKEARSLVFGHDQENRDRGVGLYLDLSDEIRRRLPKITFLELRIRTDRVQAAMKEEWDELKWVSLEHLAKTGQIILTEMQATLRSKKYGEIRKAYDERLVPHARKMMGIDEDFLQVVDDFLLKGQEMVQAAAMQIFIANLPLQVVEVEIFELSDMGKRTAVIRNLDEEPEVSPPPDGWKPVPRKYHEGDRIHQLDDLRVSKILCNKVKFIYRGEHEGSLAIGK